jgi:uncharacterized damage-inducible protein DinB
MKHIIIEYASFNFWANDRVCKVISTLTEHQFIQELESSFPSIRHTLLHIWDAQDIWLERFNGTSPQTWPSASFKGTKDELIVRTLNSSAQIIEKVKRYSEEELQTGVNYTTMKGNSGNAPRYQMFMHVVNHGTYHRGQLITMLRLVGIAELPATDLIAYYREVNDSFANP